MSIRPARSLTLAGFFVYTSSIDNETENEMTMFAYMRVSTDNKGQTTDNQRKLLTDAGFAIDEFFSEDGVSGSMKAFERPAFSAMMDKAKTGDTVIVVAVDRLGRNAVDILNVIEEFKARGVKLRVQQFDGVDLTSPTGKMLVTVMAALAEMEKNMLIERTKAGLERTKAAGTRLGRPLTIHPTILRSMKERKVAGLSLDQLAAAYSVPRNTIHRNLKEWGDNINGYEAEWNVRKAQQAA
jgi:putative DNA-invertase from lambdoid prophage Rac